MIPRFVLVLSVHSNVLRAALVTRDLHIVAAAQQSFQVTDTAFDPSEVWYKTKKVTAACLDIGRTQTREIAALGIVTAATESIHWSLRGTEIEAQGFTYIGAERDSSTSTYAGTMGAWLLWNLTGVVLEEQTVEFGATRVRAPFDAEIPVMAVLNEANAFGFVPEFEGSEEERVLIGTAQRAWGELGNRGDRE